MRWRLPLVIGMVLLSTPANAADQSVTATSSDQFTPTTVTVNQGERVTWTNVGGGEHNVTFDDGSFRDPPSPSSASWTTSRTFNTAGTFRYYCQKHGGPGGTGMSGTVVVQAAAPGGATPPGSTTPPPAGSTPRLPTAVTLVVSDRTPARGQRVRFYGSVRPERDGALVDIQRRTRTGSYRTVARTRLRDAGTTRSVYSRSLRIFSDGVYRTRVPGDVAHATGMSRIRRIVVH